MSDFVPSRGSCRFLRGPSRMPRATVHRASLPQARRADGINPKMCKFLVVDYASRAGSERIVEQSQRCYHHRRRRRGAVVAQPANGRGERRELRLQLGELRGELGGEAAGVATRLLRLLGQRCSRRRPRRYRWRAP